MATHDVPGAVSANADKLDIGAWAEHKDGSLIFVKGMESGRVIFEVYNVAVTPPIKYASAMYEGAFKKEFSYGGKYNKKGDYTWHDKTGFPWDRVMGEFADGPGYTSAFDQLNAAEQLRHALDIHGGQRVSKEEVQSRTEDRRWRRVRGIVDKLQRAIDRLPRD